MKSGIYCIVHIASGRRYIGQATNVQQRWAGHRWALNAGRHENPKLQKAWSKYGSEAFDFFVIENCPVSELDNREQHWMDRFRSYDREAGFNIARHASAPMRGRFHSDEAKARIGESARGRRFSEEAIQARVASFSGYTHSPEVRRKISEAKAGQKYHPQSDMHRESERQQAALRWADPAFREKMAALYATPEATLARSERAKRAWAKRKGLS